MSGDNPFVPREQSVRLGKFLFALSFFLPYLVTYPPEGSSVHWMDWMIYAPIWVLQMRGSIIVGGPTPMALVMFQFWIPYTLIGYQAYRYAKGRLSSVRNYFVSVISLTVISILLALPLSLIPSGFDGEVNLYSPYIPIPILPLLALLSYRLLRPTRVETPWSEEEKTDTNEESTWLS
jgi:hypothetical protein